MIIRNAVNEKITIKEDDVAEIFSGIVWKFSNNEAMELIELLLMYEKAVEERASQESFERIYRN